MTEATNRIHPLWYFEDVNVDYTHIAPTQTQGPGGGWEMMAVGPDAVISYTKWRSCTLTNCGSSGNHVTGFGGFGNTTNGVGNDFTGCVVTGTTRWIHYFTAVNANNVLPKIQ